MIECMVLLTWALNLAAWRTFQTEKDEADLLTFGIMWSCEATSIVCLAQ